MTTRNIVLVDDHIVVRSGLKELIGKLGPYNVCAEYDNGRQLIDALPLQPEPDLVILDISMPEMDGEAVMDIMKSRKVTIPVLVLTLDNDEARLIRLFRKGARGCLLKNCTAATLRNALEEIFNYGFFHNDLLALALRSEDKPPKKNEQETILAKLSQREKEFLKWICHEEEYTYGQIADLMCVQPRTVDGYREAVFEKFGVRSKTGLVLFMMRHQLLDQLS